MVTPLDNYCSRLKEVLREVGSLSENDIEYCKLLTIEEFKKPKHERRLYFLEITRGEKRIGIAGNSLDHCREKRAKLYPDWAEVMPFELPEQDSK